MKVKNKNILVIGLGRTGKSCVKYLLKQGANIFVYDDDKEKMKNFKKNGINIFNFKNLDCIDFAILSPGISKEHEIVDAIVKNKTQIISELEYAYLNLKSTDIVAITGTNGKTTTTELIFDVLSMEKKCYKCGNIGIPLIEYADKISKDDCAVIEVSSFQLEDIQKFKPHIAVITNLASDHLDRYESIADYWNAKLKIIQNLTQEDFIIANYLIFEEMQESKAKKFYFSVTNEVECGAFLKDNKIYFKESKISEPVFILNESEIHLKGKHNIENILATICVAFIEKVEMQKLINCLKEFSAIEHRFETITTINGIEFVNDSKATNIDATLKAVKDTKCNIHLLLGGSDKGENFDELFKSLPQNVFVYLFGSTTNKMVHSCLSVGFKKFKICHNMRGALEKAYFKAKRGELVLLSPACASFDVFKNYEERGKYFKEWVFALNEKEIQH